MTVDNTQLGISVRHCYWQAFATPLDGDDGHWTLVQALNGASGAVSFESINYPGYYLAPGTVGNEPARLLALQGPDANDASFAVSPAANASQYSFTSLSKNASYAGLLLSQATSITGLCEAKYQSPSGDVLLAPAGGAGLVTQAWAITALPPPPPVTLTINITAPLNTVPSRFMGCHADPGYEQSPLGFTASMVYGNSFEGAGVEASVYAWNPVSAPRAVGSAALDSSQQVNPKVNAPSLKVTYTSGSGYLGWSNRGIGNEGLAWSAGKEYVAMAVVYAPTGATLYFGTHDRTAGVVDASATVTVPASSAWQVVNATLVPSADANCVGIVNGSDPTVSCSTTAGTGGSGDPTNPGQICVRCDGEFAVGLAAPGTAWIGFTDLRPGAWGTFGPRGAAQKRTLEVLQSMGTSTIRQGGTVSQTFAWKDWRGAPWQRAAMQHYWEDRLIPSTWGLFEFIDTATAAGIEPIVTLAYDLNSVQDWGDLVEYCWGNVSTTWGAVRTYNDSHPEPYQIRMWELGNEQDNPDFVAQVAEMEARAAAVGAPALKYVYPSNPGTFPNATAQGILNLGGAELAARTMPDIHIWGSQGGVQAAYNLAADLPNYPSSFVNMEVNARTSTLDRGINEAADLQSWFNVPAPFVDRLVTRTTSFCTERSSHYDGYDQGLVFFLPNMTWLQPPAYVHTMVAASLAKANGALAVATSSAGDASWLAASAQMSDDQSLLVVQLVNQNAYGQAGQVVLSLQGTGFTPAGAVVITTLADPAADVSTGIRPNATAGNTPYQPTYVSPQTVYQQWPRGSPTWTVTVPPFAFWVLEIYGST